MGLRLVLLAGTVVLAACQAPGASVDSLESHAVDVAVRRAQLDAMCANVTPSVLEQRQVTKAAPANADTTFEYSISVEGCGQRKTSRVVCPAVGSACFVAQDRTNG